MIFKSNSTMNWNFQTFNEDCGNYENKSNWRRRATCQPAKCMGTVWDPGLRIPQNMIPRRRRVAYVSFFVQEGATAQSLVGLLITCPVRLRHPLAIWLEQSCSYTFLFIFLSLIRWQPFDWRYPKQISTVSIGNPKRGFFCWSCWSNLSADVIPTSFLPILWVKKCTGGAASGSPQPPALIVYGVGWDATGRSWTGLVRLGNVSGCGVWDIHW